MAQPAPKTTPTQNILAARVAAQARQQQSQQPAANPALPARPAASLTPIRPIRPPQAAQQPSPMQQPSLMHAPVTLSSRDPAALTASELDTRLRGAVTTAHRSTCELIYYGYRLKLATDWRELGFATEEAYVESLGIGWMMWDRWIRIGERLAHLTLTEMTSISQRALGLLASVQPDLWPEYAWLEEAKVLPAREFEMLVKQRNHEHQPAGSRGLLSEPRADIKVAIPISQQAVLQRRLDQLRRRERLATTGEALVYALAATDRAGQLEDSLAAIQPSLAELARLWKPAEEWSAGLQESVAEKAARLEQGLPSLSDVAQRTQQLTRTILRELRSLDLEQPEQAQAGQQAKVKEDAPDGSILPQEVPQAGAAPAGTPL